MVAFGCKIGSKLGHFQENRDFFTQNRRGQGVVKIRDKKFLTQPKP